MALRLYSEGILAARAALIDLDYWTVRYEGADGWKEGYTWDRIKDAWVSVPGGSRGGQLSIECDEGIVMSFLDHDGREAHQLESEFVFFTPELKQIDTGRDSPLARMAAGTGEWEISSRPGLWCPRVVFSPISAGLVFEPVALQATPRGRLSGLAERVMQRP